MGWVLVDTIGDGDVDNNTSSTTHQPFSLSANAGEVLIVCSTYAADPAETATIFDPALTLSKPGGESASWVEILTMDRVRQFDLRLRVFAIKTTTAWSAHAFTLTWATAVTARRASWSRWSGGKITLRGATAPKMMTTGTTQTVSGSQQPQAGDLVIGAGFTFSGGSGPTGDTDTTNGSWVTVGRSVTTGGGGQQIVQSKVVSATGDQTYNPATLPGANDTVGAVVLQPALETPGTPTALTVTGETTTALTLNWSAPSGGGPVAGYEVRIDGGSWIDVGTALDYEFTGLTPSTTYTLEVRAYNEDGASSPASIDGTTLDTPPVVIPVVAPSGGRIDPLLSVRIVSAETGQDVHVEHRGLRWKKVSDGGWKSLEARIRNRPDFTLGPNDRVYVYDRTGNCVMEGYLDNPAQVRGPAGQFIDITASGPAALASDASYEHVVIDKIENNWDDSEDSSTRSRLSTVDVAVDNPALQVNTGSGTIGTNFRGIFQYRALDSAGQRLARLTYSTISGVNDADFRLIANARDGIGGSADELVNEPAATTIDNEAVNAESTGKTVAELRVNRVDTSIAGTDLQIFSFYNIVVRAVLRDIFGDEITSGYGTNTVYPHQIVADMIGRGLLPLIDPNRTAIDADTSGVDAVDQFAYPGGVTGRGAMDALSILSPNFTWGYGPSNEVGHSFHYRAVASDPTYIFGPEHGISTPGSDIDLVNRVQVTWEDRKGRPRAVTVTSTVPRLGSRVRDFPAVPLPREIGTKDNAQQVGELILELVAEVPTASTVSVRRPVLNLSTGRMDNPWELEPGSLGMLRDTGQVEIITSVDYDHQPNRVATVTIGRPPLNVDELVANLTKRGPASPKERRGWTFEEVLNLVKGTQKK